MSGKFYKVGEEFEFMDVVLKVLPNPAWDCSMCYFLGNNCCVNESVDDSHNYPECVTDFREDGESVYFEEIKS